MKAPLLSICIATYNRANYIGETIESIIPQLDDDVELLVVDGASTDNTEAVVQKYAQKESSIRYVRLAAKGGVDQDYDKSVELAHGKFCWLFADDDLLNPEAISAVKDAIKEGHGFVIVNAEVRDKELSTILSPRRIKIQNNKIYPPTSMEHLFIDALQHLSFIGAVVIRRSIWLSRNRESYYGTEFVHVGVIFQKPLTETTLIIAEPYISIRFGNSQWTPRSFNLWMFKWPELIWSFNNISKEAKQSVCLKEPWRVLRHIMVHRSAGSYNIQIYRQYLSSSKSGVFWKFLVRLIAYLPQKVFVGIHYIFTRIKGGESEAFFDAR